MASRHGPSRLSLLERVRLFWRGFFFLVEGFGGLCFSSIAFILCLLRIGSINRILSEVSSYPTLPNDLFLVVHHPLPEPVVRHYASAFPLVTFVAFGAALVLIGWYSDRAVSEVAQSLCRGLSDVKRALVGR